LRAIEPDQTDARAGLDNDALAHLVLWIPRKSHFWHTGQ
jgi:hypothetical protein